MWCGERAETVPDRLIIRGRRFESTPATSRNGPREIIPGRLPFSTAAAAGRFRH
jgi:hypothetical protein